MYDEAFVQPLLLYAAHVYGRWYRWRRESRIALEKAGDLESGGRRAGLGKENGEKVLRGRGRRARET